MPGDQTNGSSSGRDEGGRAQWGLMPWERLSQTFLRNQGSRREVLDPDIDVTRLSDEEKRAMITRIDPRERIIGFGAAALAGALGLGLNLPYIVAKIKVPNTAITPKNGHCPKGLTYVKSGNTCNQVFPPSHYVLPLVVTLVLAIAIYITVRIGRRAPVAFATAITGISLGSLFLIIPFLGVAGWLLLRSYRFQKNGSPTAKAPIPGWEPPARAPGRSRAGWGTRASPSATPAKSRSGKATPQAAQRKPPSANKRYTPKAPPKKRPAPPPAAAKPPTRSKSKSGPSSKSDTRGK